MKGGREHPVSKAQMRWAFGTHQPFAEEWSHRKNLKRLPEKVRHLAKEMKKKRKRRK